MALCQPFYGPTSPAVAATWAEVWGAESAMQKGCSVSGGVSKSSELCAPLPMAHLVCARYQHRASHISSVRPGRESLLACLSS